MPTVQVTVTLSIPEGSIALEALEEEIAQVVEAAGRQLLLRACKAMEAAHLQRQAASLRRDKQRPLDLLTRFGWGRLGVLTSGKALESLTAKHRRYRLLERVRYGGVESAGDFGERLFLAREARLGLSRAQHLLLVGDGADWIEALAGHDRWRATYQLDWWHLGRALHRTFPDHPQLRRRLQTALYAGDGQHLIRLVRLAQSAGRGDPHRLATL